tara:strand:+ start:130 stop:537 length:408 start_codon:yes stop_codon:yes gene_type:complete
MTSSFRDPFGPRAFPAPRDGAVPLTPPGRDDYFDIGKYRGGAVPLTPPGRDEYFDMEKFKSYLDGTRSLEELSSRLDEYKEKYPQADLTRKERRIARKTRRAARRGDSEKFEKLLNRARRLGRKEARRARRRGRD